MNLGLIVVKKAKIKLLKGLNWKLLTARGLFRCGCNKMDNNSFRNLKINFT